MQFKRANIYAVALDRWSFDEGNAKNWVGANNFKTEERIDDDAAFVFVQRQKGDFKLKAFGRDDQFVAVTVAPGVVALVGELEEGAKGAKRADVFQVKAVGIKIEDEEQRLITGPVLIPYEVDLQGDWELPEDIEKAAHGFLANPNRKVGIQHVKFGDFADIVESWVLREPIWTPTVKGGSRFFPKGTWFMTYYVKSDEAWKAIKNGEIDGFSIGYTGQREEV